jgi:hypothetical protein
MKHTRLGSMPKPWWLIGPAHSCRTPASASGLPDSPKANEFHRPKREPCALSGPGQHSIRINNQWRIVFIWREDGAHAVEIVDYH